MSNFNVLYGKVLTGIERSKDDGGDVLTFTTSDGDKYLMCHHPECCDYVDIEDICGELDDLIGHPILLAEDVSNDSEVDRFGGQGTWTFYKLSTVKGSVTIRWYGYDDYYSVEVRFDLIQ